ncbi:CLIP-associating protein isoform 1 [Schistosoma japonicum]|uniref:CLIP-associating protein isoform 1 n=1 Tax=Schistosoma japonicum TaxID=6182 RepID=A0A4Z2DG68_SCHJA|nr:CLIP-associating protein isoform 1 [Schistosoma japonicum]
MSNSAVDGIERRPGTLSKTSVSGGKSIRKRSTGDSQGAGAVDEDVFRQSFIPSMSITASSAKELIDIMNRIKDTLSGNPEEWEKRVDALKTLRAIVANGALQYDEFIPSLKTLENCIDLSLRDLRSSVVREACITVAFLSQEIRSRFDRFAESVLQTIIALLSNSAKVMATSGVVAMRFILENTFSSRLLPILISALSSKSNITRKCICEFLEIIFRTWPTNILEKNLSVLQDALRRGISDADQEARQFSRRSFPLFVEKFPEQANLFLQNLDAQKRKLIEKDLIAAGLPLEGIVSGEINTTASSRSQSGGAGSQSNLTYQSTKRPNRPVLGTSSLANNTNRSRPPLTSQNEYNTVGRYVRQGSIVSNYDSRSLHTGRKLVSQSQPTSREVSPSRLAYFTTYGATVNDAQKLQFNSTNTNRSGPTIGLDSAERIRLGINSRVPRSQGASREPSPTRSTASGYTMPSYQHNNTFQLSGASQIGQMNYRKQQRPSLGTLSDCADLGDGPLYGRHYSVGNNRGPYGSDDNFSETSSQCSERSGRSVPGYRRQPSVKVTSNLKEIIAQLQAVQWSDKKDGLTNLQNYLRSGYPLNPDDIRSLTEIFSKMFADSQSKVVSLFMDTLQFFIKEYNPLLRDWLYTLLIRLLYRQSHEALSSHQKAIQETLFVLRSHFPLNSQFNSCCHFIMDNAHTPNFRVKTCLLEYLKDLILMMSPDAIANPSNEVTNAIGKIISWSAEPKSADVRRMASRVVIKLFDLNATSFSTLLQSLPRGVQDRAHEVLKTYQKTATGGGLMNLTDTNHNHNSSWKSSSGPLRKYSLPVTTGRSSMTRSVDQDHIISSPPGSGRYASIGGPCSTYSAQRSHDSASSGRVSPESMNRIMRETTDGLQSLSLGGGYSGMLTSVTSPTRRASADPGFTTSPLQYGTNDYNAHITNGNPGVLRTMQPSNFSNSQQAVSQPCIIPSNMNQTYASSEGVPNDPTSQSTYGLRTNKAPLNTLINYDPTDGPKLKKPVIGYQTLKKIREMPPEDIMSEILQELSNHNERYEQRKTCMLKLMKLLRDGAISNWDEYFKPTLLILLETLGDDGHETRALALRVLQELVRAKPELFHDFAYLFVIKVLEACRDSEKSVVRAAEECANTVAQSLPQELCLNVLTPLINDSQLHINLPAIKMQMQVVQNSSPELVHEFVNALIPGLVIACNHEESAIRKASVFCLVAIAMKLGDDIWSYLTELNAGKKRLLKLYIDRQQNSTTSEDSITTRS